MENATEALKMAFAVLVFVIALSVAFFMISLARQSADAVFSIEDKEKYFQDGLEGVTYLTAGANEKVVGWDAVVSAIYRYDTQNNSVTIIDRDEANPVIARFSSTTEDIAKKMLTASNSQLVYTESVVKNHLKYLSNKVIKDKVIKDKVIKDIFPAYIDTKILEWKGVFERLYSKDFKAYLYDAQHSDLMYWRSGKAEDLKERLERDVDELSKTYKDKTFKERVEIIKETESNGDVKENIEIIFEVN